MFEQDGANDSWESKATRSCHCIISMFLDVITITEAWQLAKRIQESGALFGYIFNKNCQMLQKKNYLTNLKLSTTIFPWPIVGRVNIYFFLSLTASFLLCALLRHG